MCSLLMRDDAGFGASVCAVGDLAQEGSKTQNDFSKGRSPLGTDPAVPKARVATCYAC